MKLIKDLGVVSGRRKGIYECTEHEAIFKACEWILTKGSK